MYLRQSVGKSVLVGALCVTSLTLWAAAPQLDPLVEQKRIQEREDAMRQKLERTPDVRLPSQPVGALAAIPTGEQPCFVIHKIQLDGADAEDFQWVLSKLTREDELSPLGQCLGAQGISFLITRGQNALVERGYVTTRLLAVPQDLKTGELKLNVMVGRIAAIKLAPGSNPETNPLGTALPMKAGDVLNLRDIEQALENLKRVPTAEADIQIEPADAPDQSNLVISYKQDFPLRLSASLDDSGTKATGKHQGSVTLSVDNLAMLNDLFYVTSNGSLGKDSSDHATRGQTIHYSFPIGYWTIGATTSSSRYFQHVAGLNQIYKYSGESENNDIKLSRLVWRDSQHKTTVALKVFQRKSSNYIDDTEVDVQRRVVGGWESSINHKASLDGATIEGNLSYKRGERVFGSLPAPEESFGEGTSLFALYAADATLTVPFQWVDQKWRFNSNWRGQKHHSPLTPQDRFSIGGRFSVRGFDGETILSAESGWVLRNDLGLSLGDSGQELYVGLDQGEVSGPSADLLVGHRLTGAVLGLRGGIGKAQYDIFFGAPVTKPDAFRTSATTAGFSLNLSF